MINPYCHNTVAVNCASSFYTAQSGSCINCVSFFVKGRIMLVFYGIYSMHAAEQNILMYTYIFISYQSAISKT